VIVTDATTYVLAPKELDALAALVGKHVTITSQGKGAQ